jgi:hypothetical protein
MNLSELREDDGLAREVHPGQDPTSVRERLPRPVERLDKGLPQRGAEHHEGRIRDVGVPNVDDLRPSRQRETGGERERRKERPRHAQDRLAMLGPEVSDHEQPRQLPRGAEVADHRGQELPRAPEAAVARVDHSLGHLDSSSPPIVPGFHVQ